MDGFGAPLEHAQDGEIINPVLCILCFSHTTIESGHHWTLLALQPGSIAWDMKRLRGYL